jgi:riboflavin biosynthesis pyrimidine reductase
LESGPTLNGAMLSAAVVHKLMLFYAPKFAGDSSVPLARMPPLEHGPLPNLRVTQFGPDVAIQAYLRDVYRKI